MHVNPKSIGNDCGGARVPVYYRGDEVVIERAGKTMAVVIPADRYEALERSRERLFDLIEKAQARVTKLRAPSSRAGEASPWP